MTSYSTVGCQVPFLTKLDPNNSSVLLSEPCAVTYAEFVGTNYIAVTAFFSTVIGVSLVVAIVQLCRLFRAYGIQAGLKSVQVWMHIRIVVMYFFMFINSWDLLGYTSWFPYQLATLCRFIASFTGYLLCFALMFVWYRTATELNKGKSQTVDKQERAVSVLLIFLLVVLIILYLSWSDLPSWRFDAGYYGLMAVTLTVIYALNFYFGYNIYSNLSQSSKLSGRTKGQSWRTFFSGKSDVWKVVRVVLSGFILAVVCISLQIISCLRAVKHKFGVTASDNHRPVLISIPELIGGYGLFILTTILGHVLLYSFKNIRAKPPSTSRGRSQGDLKSPRSRKGTVDDRFSALDNSRKVPSLDDIALGPEPKGIPSFGGSSIDLILPTTVVAVSAVASTAPSSNASGADVRSDLETPAPPSGDSSV